MSRFYADISGGRGTATRQGHAQSGIRGHLRGWNSGVRVVGYARDEDDCFDVFVTSGSHARHTDRLLGTVTVDGDGNPVFTAA